MNEFALLDWGLLGIDSSGSLRRTRTLGLGSAVRRFNDLAVPDMGNVWYAKQIYLSILGIAVAERVRQKYPAKNIEIANAIEAVACLLSYEENDWNKDRRLRGINKLRGVQERTFSVVRKPGFYVTQPMRMGTVQALPGLGLVFNDTTRFNSYELTDLGNTLVSRITESYGNVFRKDDLIENLKEWVQHGKTENGRLNTQMLRKALSPLEKLDSSSGNMIKRIVLKEGPELNVVRRQAILKWMDLPEVEKKGHWSWEKRPGFIDELHWKDMNSGALFFTVRDKAWSLLDELEIYISRLKANKVSLKQASNDLIHEQNNLKEAASDFLRFNHDPSPEKEASKFCRECLDDESRIRKLVTRDGLGLMLRGEIIIPGSAFKGALLNKPATDDDDEMPISDSPKLPPKIPYNISYRVLNMFYLNQDFKGRLNIWLK
jgi:hypothetical protein